MEKHNKVLVVGLDGVPLDLIDGWVRQGELPTFSYLIRTGAVGPLRSTVPPTSGPSWSSFATGMNPGRTGIYDFLYRRDGTYRFPPVNASQRGGVSLWQILSLAGKKVGVLNMPMSYPVEVVNGFMVSGWMTPSGAADYCYPSALIAELQREVGFYHIYPTETFAESRRESFLQACYDLLDLRLRTALYLMETRPWDFFMTVFFDTDRILHQLWHYLDPSHPWWGEQGEEHSEIVLEYFRRVDEGLSRLIDRAGEGALVMVMSDHGMGPAHNFIVLNNWLLDVGLLRLKRNPLTRLKSWAHRRGFTLRNVHKLADRLGLAKYAEYKGLYSMDHLLKLVFLSFLDVDWSRSRAYSFGRHLGSIYVNLKGREPKGMVEPGEEYEAVRDEIEQMAYDFRDPRTGRPLVGQVLRREELYAGPFVHLAPDMILRPDRETDIFFGLADFGSNVTVDRVYRYSGMHRDDGLLMMSGPPIRAGTRIEGSSIQDLAPTILYAMDVTVPWAMDGEVLLQAFEEAYVRENGVSYGEIEAPPSAGPGGGYGQAEEREIVGRLRGMGYLG